MNLQQLWATIAPYLPIIVVGLITAGVTFYGPQIVARYPRLGVVIALARRVGLDLSAPQTGRDAYERYAAAKGFISATGTDLPPWEELPARERAAWDASVEALRALRPASTPPPPPSIPPAAMVLLLVLVPTLHGCGASMKDAADALNAANTIATEAQPCLVSQRAELLAQCDGDTVCEGAVKEKFSAIADAYDVLHAGWCVLVPDADGCAK